MEGSSHGLIFKVLSQHLPGGTEENHRNLIQGSWSPGLDLNPRPPKYEALDHDVQIIACHRRKVGNP
jgi:hypothetical protein